MMESIILIGMPQCGKSTVGKIISDRIGYPLRDIDRMVEEAYFQKRSTPMSCHDIYKKEGEAYFRGMEKESFDKAVLEDHTVIATGGGTPIYHPTFNKQTENSQVVFLYCTFDVLWKRISALSQMPALISVGNPFMTLQQLYNTRLIQYLANSHHKIDASSKNPEEIAEAILSVTNICV